MGTLFGPAGTPDSFNAMGYKKTIEVPDYIVEMGLDCFEYQCGRGVKIGATSAAALGNKAKEKGIKLSLHAPYYISLSSLQEEKRNASVRYILQSAVAADAMGANRIVVHSGSCAKISRQEALHLAKDTIKKACLELDNAGLSHIHPCPETMGKINQLGTLEEVVELCKVDERLIPCIDFGHLYARTLGGIKTKEDYEFILDYIENHLGGERASCFHSHFSQIEYSLKGGEVKHLTFEDTVYGPKYDPLMELIAKRGLSPTIICESRGTQAEDAATMKQCYAQYCKKYRG